MIKDFESIMTRFSLVFCVIICSCRIQSAYGFDIEGILSAQMRIVIMYYRVSHLKLTKVIWLCWGYRFLFLLIFRVLRVHEKGTFMLNSPVFIFLMLGTFYRMMICKNAKSFFGRNSLNVSNVKRFSNIFFQHF